MEENIEKNIEESSIIDLSEDFCTPEELNYYLSLK